MGKEFSNMMSAFWTTTMDKLNDNTDKKEVINNVIKDICRYFNFGCSFLYTCDKDNVATLSAAHHAYLNFEHLTPVFNIKEVLGTRKYNLLLEKDRVSFDRLTKKTELDKTFEELYHAQSLILVPIKNKEGMLRGLLGMADRRGECREGDQDLTFAYYILVVFANYISIYLAQQRNESMMKTLSKVMNNSGVEVHVIDYETNEMLYINEEFTKKFGTLPLGIKCYEFFYPGQGKVCDFCAKVTFDTKDFEIGKPVSYQQKNSRGEHRRYIATKFYWVDGRIALAISSIDITENIYNERKLRYYSQHDELTSLGNRHKLLLDCDDFLEQLRTEKRQGYVMFADVDKFKDVNDQYGHTIGDALLREIGKFFNTYEKTKNRAYRYAGDEFVFLLDQTDKDGLEQVKDHIINRFKAPWNLGEVSVLCGISVGVTETNGKGRTTTDLLNDADARMYEMKTRNKEG